MIGAAASMLMPEYMAAQARLNRVIRPMIKAIEQRGVSAFRTTFEPDGTLQIEHVPHEQIFLNGE